LEWLQIKLSQRLHKWKKKVIYQSVNDHLILVAIAPPPKNNVVEWDDFGEFQSNITNVESKGWANFD
jgi:hypothetical protein